MNTKALVFALAAACIGSAAPAFAQNYERDGRYEQRDNRYEQHHDSRTGWNDRSDRRDGYERHDRHAHYDRYDRREQRAIEREHRREIRREVREYNRYARGAGPRYDLYRGGRLPSVYHGERYVVRDYHRYNLSAPPRGTHWVRAGNDYLLVALATGIIAQVLLN